MVDSASPQSAPHDPPAGTIVKRHLAEIRAAEHRVVQARHWLASYLSTHAAPTCQAKDGVLNMCTSPVDGMVLVSCGHWEYFCSEHGSAAMRSYGSSASVTCVQTDPDFHAAPARGVTLEWSSLV